jgi:hypothetical protein
MEPRVHKPRPILTLHGVVFDIFVLALPRTALAPPRGQPKTKIF